MLSRLDKHRPINRTDTQRETQTDVPLELLKVLVCSNDKKARAHIDEPQVDESAQLESSSSSIMVQHKEAGNVLFRQGNNLGALAYYKRALTCKPASAAALLLSNRSLCTSNMQEHVQAALDADAAIVISADLEKAHYRRAVALVDLGMVDAALLLLQDAPSSNTIANLAQHLRLASKLAERLRLETRSPSEADP
jgi:tetratricopeptide (TPR) repeat protein